jgi:hypothetical protein
VIRTATSEALSFDIEPSAWWYSMCWAPIHEARQVSSRAASSSVARSASAKEMPCLSRIGSPNASRLEA